MPIRFHDTKRCYSSSFSEWPSERRIASVGILGLLFWLVRLFLDGASVCQSREQRRFDRGALSALWPTFRCHAAERSTGGGSHSTPHKTIEMQLKNKQMFGVSKAQAGGAPAPSSDRKPPPQIRSSSRALYGPRKAVMPHSPCNEFPWANGCRRWRCRQGSERGFRSPWLGELEVGSQTGR